MQNNHLANETSPYLLQHKDNPVEWYPWGQLALDKAHRENKPILLSIGYSACHWCHVMAHESFEDDKTASIMNEHFINIKVDREERPDLDKIYQTVHSLLTQRSGGWPLTVFLTPDEHMPIFAGTYFPNEARYGMPSFNDILLRIADAYKHNQENIKHQNDAVRDVFERISQQEQHSSDRVNAKPLDMARTQLAKNFDPEFGGFGTAPKFPHPTNIEVALRRWAQSVEYQQEDFDILHTAIFTLERMAEGGMFDQLGGGFCRYSVDHQWMIPHFEKMLYDNGPLLALYTQAYQIYERPLFQQTINELANWVVREMQSTEGGYYSSLDADSEDEEGKFYVWQVEEIRHHLDAETYPLFAEHFGLDQPANFEEKNWNLHVYKNMPQLAEKYDLPVQEIKSRINAARQKLFEIRAARIHPGRDDKILTSWNALMIKGMSLAGRSFQQADYITSARRSLDFIRDKLWQNNRLLATYKDGRAHLNAYLDDYAYCLDATLTLLATEWDNDYFEFAQSLADTLLEQFEDKQHGGFYFTSHDHEKLITRQKSYHDDAMPSGNGVAASALQTLGHLSGKTQYLYAAERALKNSFHSIEQSPLSHASLLLALEDYLLGISIVIVRGDAEQLQLWKSQLSQNYSPRVHYFFIDDSVTLSEYLADKKPLPNCGAYICRKMNCLPPVYSVTDLLQTLKVSPQ